MGGAQRNAHTVVAKNEKIHHEGGTNIPELSCVGAGTYTWLNGHLFAHEFMVEVHAQQVYLMFWFNVESLKCPSSLHVSILILFPYLKNETPFLCDAKHTGLVEALHTTMEARAARDTERSALKIELWLSSGIVQGSC